MKRSKEIAIILSSIIFISLLLRENLLSAPKNIIKNDLLYLEKNPVLHSNNLPTPWAVSYSPYTPSGNCKNAKDIYNDLNSLSNLGTKAIRLFSDDCEVLEMIGKFPKLKLILGIHPHSENGKIEEFNQSLKEQLNEITKSGCWSKTDMLVVGSQGVFADIYSRSDLVKMIRFVRKELAKIDGFKGLISTAEPVQSYISSTKYNAVSKAEYKLFQKARNLETSKRDSIVDRANESQYEDYQQIVSSIEDNDLCSVVDVVGLVIQPFFNSAIDSSNAGTIVSRDVRFAKYLCSDQFIGSAHKASGASPLSAPLLEPTNDDQIIYISNIPPVAVLEAGWPSSGKSNGQAIASLEHQKIAIEKLLTARDSQTNERIPVALYSYENEVWRDPGLLEVETSFGIKGQYL